MKIPACKFLILFFCSAFAATIVSAADERPSAKLGEIGSEVPYAASVAESWEMKGKGLPWAHQINVVLPASYDVLENKNYPVLWLTDGDAFLHMIPGLVRIMNYYDLLPEMIIVTVGNPSSSTISEWRARRINDFLTPNATVWPQDEADDPARLLIMKQGAGVASPSMKDAHADKFLDFLIDEVRPLIEEKYRVKNDHALFGHSGGGMFTAYAIFARPGGFDRYLIGSGTMADTLEMEKRYAKKHDDLKARIFIGAGDIEASKIFGASARLASNPMRLGENLILRQYPSLDIEIAMYRKKGHISVVPLLLTEGLAFIYSDLLDQEGASADD